MGGTFLKRGKESTPLKKYKPIIKKVKNYQKLKNKRETARKVTLYKQNSIILTDYPCYLVY